jgi:hypothetical protein
LEMNTQAVVGAVGRNLLEFSEKLVTCWSRRLNDVYNKPKLGWLLTLATPRDTHALYYIPPCRSLISEKMCEPAGRVASKIMVSNFDRGDGKQEEASSRKLRRRKKMQIGMNIYSCLLHICVQLTPRLY